MPLNDYGYVLYIKIINIKEIDETSEEQYVYPCYAYDHPLFTKDMRIYSDSKVSDFLSQITDDQSTGFLNDWNSGRNYREKI